MAEWLNKLDLEGHTIRLAGWQPKNFSPWYGCPTFVGDQIVAIDDSNNLMTRGQVHTDEGSFRDNFSGSTVGTAVGNATFTKWSNIVTGSGFASKDIHKQDYIKVTADWETAYAQVLYVTDTRITLYGQYTGTTTVDGAMTCIISPTVTGTGGSITCATGQESILTGTTSGSKTGIYRNVDFGPLIYQAKFSRSQTIANTDFYAGVSDSATTDPTAARWFARFKFTGTTNTQVVTETGFNRTTTPTWNELESNIITLPNSLTTATSNVYRIEQWIDYVKFYINGQLVATHTQSIPRPPDLLMKMEMAVNTGVPASTTTHVIDYSWVKDLNRVDVGSASIDEYPGSIVKTTLPTAFTAGQIATNTATTSWVQVVRQNSVPEMEWQYAAAASGILNTTTAVTIKAAAGAGVRNYITGIQFSAEALGTATEIAVRDGAAGTVIWRHKIGTGGVTGGLNLTFNTPLKWTANTLLEVVTLTASTTGAVYFNAQGYQAY